MFFIITYAMINQKIINILIIGFICYFISLFIISKNLIGTDYVPIFILLIIFDFIIVFWIINKNNKKVLNKKNQDKHHHLSLNQDDLSISSEIEDYHMVHDSSSTIDDTSQQIFSSSPEN